MTTAHSAIRRPHTVTFDCWCTLILDAEPGAGLIARSKILADAAGTDVPTAQAALNIAWRRHQLCWHRRTVFGAADMTRLALDKLKVSLEPGRFELLVDALVNEGLVHSVQPLDGARATLERLAEHGVRRALICDTGFTPGRVVRQLLERVGLLDLLEVLVFSDEVGAPKPHRRAFDEALNGLGVGPAGAVHVGDLRRSDIAGARSVGMASVRITAHNDDADGGPTETAGVIDCGLAGCEPPCARPEADAVASSHAHLLELLAYA